MRIKGSLILVDDAFINVCGSQLETPDHSVPGAPLPEWFSVFRPYSISIPNHACEIIRLLVDVEADLDVRAVGDDFPSCSRKKLAVAQPVQKIPHRILRRLLRRSYQINSCIMRAEDVALPAPEVPDRQFLRERQSRKIILGPHDQTGPGVAGPKLEGRAGDSAEILRQVLCGLPDLWRGAVADYNFHPRFAAGGQPNFGRLRARDCRTKADCQRKHNRPYA